MTHYACRHGHELEDCYERCDNCLHACRVHDIDSPGECLEAFCGCQEWVEEEEEEP